MSETNPNGVLVADGLNGVAEFPKIPPPDDVVDGVAPNIPLGAGVDVAPKIPPLLVFDGAEFVDVKVGFAPNIPPVDFFVSPNAKPLVGFELPKVLLLPAPNALPLFVLGACVVDC